MALLQKKKKKKKVQVIISVIALLQERFNAYDCAKESQVKITDSVHMFKTQLIKLKT